MARTEQGTTGRSRSQGRDGAVGERTKTPQDTVEALRKRVEDALTLVANRSYSAAQAYAIANAVYTIKWALVPPGMMARVGYPEAMSSAKARRTAKTTRVAPRQKRKQGGYQFNVMRRNAQIRAFYKSGYSVTYLAHHYGLSRGTINTILRRAR